ncbi:MAG: hypothetical protein Q9208_007724 [Pyrenodesmia sp. 3 TL-2023]
MCIIKIRRDQSEESPVVVPIRPASRGHQPTATITTHPTSRISPRVSATAGSPQMSRMQQQLRASAGSINHRRSGSQQQIVIAQPSPRTSRPRVPLQHGSSYSYGSGPVPTRESLDRLQLSSSQQAQQIAMVGRRSAGSVTFGGANADPRGSHVSHRFRRRWSLPPPLPGATAEDCLTDDGRGGLLTDIVLADNVGELRSNPALAVVVLVPVRRGGGGGTKATSALLLVEIVADGGFDEFTAVLFWGLSGAAVSVESSVGFFGTGGASFRLKSDAVDGDKELADAVDDAAPLSPARARALEKTPVRPSADRVTRVLR